MSGLTGMDEHVVLVNHSDRQVGVASKRTAHAAGLLHRAFSVCIFDTVGQMLLQRRAHGKYHSGGLWSNSCCSHPRPGEPAAQAAARRLAEELGFTCALSHAFAFIYRADVGGGLIEHEYDHVYTGVFDGPVTPHPEEIAEYRWIEPAALLRELDTQPDAFTAWSRIAFDELRSRGYLAVREAQSSPRNSRIPSHGNRKLQSGNR
jgi:isopentenyl-diphosphate Delta-isomerase